MYSFLSTNFQFFFYIKKKIELFFLQKIYLNIYSKDER
jgi:hypothetical protein